MGTPAAGCRFDEALHLRALVGMVGNPQPADGMVAEDPFKPTDVVDIAVCADEEINSADVMASKRLSQQQRVASAIDKHHPTGGVAEQHRVSLPDVEERHHRDARRATRNKHGDGKHNSEASDGRWPRAFQPDQGRCS